MKIIRNAPNLKKIRSELRQDQTGAEKIMWKHLRNRQFGGLKFFRQYSVGAYILDFYCPKIMLALELDGGQHGEDEKIQYDNSRSEYLKTQGIEVMRFWNNEVMKNIEGVLEAIMERITPPNLPLPQGEESTHNATKVNDLRNKERETLPQGEESTHNATKVNDLRNKGR